MAGYHIHKADNKDPTRCCITSVSNYLQVVEALLEGADKVGDLLVLEGQRVGDLTQRLLSGEERHPVFQALHLLWSRPPLQQSSRVEVELPAVCLCVTQSSESADSLSLSVSQS